MRQPQPQGLSSAMAPFAGSGDPALGGGGVSGSLRPSDGLGSSASDVVLNHREKPANLALQGGVEREGGMDQTTVLGTPPTMS